MRWAFQIICIFTALSCQAKDLTFINHSKETRIACNDNVKLFEENGDSLNIGAAEGEGVAFITASYTYTMKKGHKGQFYILYNGSILKQKVIPKKASDNINGTLYVSGEMRKVSQSGNNIVSLKAVGDGAIIKNQHISVLLIHDNKNCGE